MGHPDVVVPAYIQPFGHAKGDGEKAALRHVVAVEPLLKARFYTALPSLSHLRLGRCVSATFGALIVPQKL